MALNLSVPEGSKVYVGDQSITVLSVELKDRHTPVEVRVVTSGGTEAVLAEDRTAELFPGVFVAVGLKNQIGTASLVFDAPAEVLILTEKNYLKAKSEAAND